MIDSHQLLRVELTRSEFSRTWAVLDQGLQDEVAPGFVVGFWKKEFPNQIWTASAGMRRVIPSPLPMHTDTIFDLASLTKVMATSSLVAVLVDRGWLNWNTSIQSIFPDYPFPDIQIQHLLSHTAGFEAWEPFWERIQSQLVGAGLSRGRKSLDQISIQARQACMKKMIFSIVPEAEPGERMIYSDISFLILGFVLEALTGSPLDHAVRRWVWKPMGLRDAHFRRVRSSSSQSLADPATQMIAATEDSAWRGGILQGQVHDDNCWAMGGYAGHAGVFGTIQDVLHFGRAFFLGFLSPSVLNAFWSRVARPVGCVRTLGWDTPSGENSSAGHYFSKRSVGHLGFTGVSLWIDPEAEISVALLSNRVHPSRENKKIQAFRPLFHDALRMDLKLT